MKHLKNVCIFLVSLLLLAVGSFKAKDIGNPMIAKIRAEKKAAKKAKELADKKAKEEEKQRQKQKEEDAKKAAQLAAQQHREIISTITNSYCLSKIDFFNLR